MSSRKRSIDQISEAEELEREEALERDLHAFANTADPSQHFPTKTEDYNSLPTFPDRPHFRDFLLNMKPATQLICFDGCPNDPYRPSSMPLYQTATFVQPSSSEFGPYDYTRSGNPTRTALETLIAGLEQAHSAFAFVSGMAALGSVTRLVKAGEEIIACKDLYGGMYRLLTRVCQRQGVSLQFVDTSNLDEVARAISDKTRLIHIETPSNPLMIITDLRKLAALAHKHNALLSVDSTMMSPHLQKPLSLGADVVVHSATKFLNGHSDVMGGVVCVSSDELAKEIAFYQNAEGTALSPFDCWLMMRSLKTMAIRVERAQSNAERVVEYLCSQACITKVHYPGVKDFEIRKGLQVSPTDEQLKVHLEQSHGGGSLLSFETGSVELSRRIVDACRLFKITVSFGSCNSLVEMPCVLSHASIPAGQRTLPEDLVRLSIGIEDVEDILTDLKRAVRVALSNVENVRAAAE